MIETRDGRNSRPLHQSPDRKHRGKQQHQHQQQKKADNYPSMMYGTLKGEDLLDNSGSSLDNINDGNNMSSTPQSVEMGQYSSSEYHQPLMNGTTTTTTKIQNNNISPLSGLPPAIPLRRRADSSGDRSMGELSTVSGVSGHNRIHRTSSSDGYEQVLNNHYNNNSTTLSPGSSGNYHYQSPGANSNMSNNNYAIPPKPSMVPRQRSSNNTRPVRRRSRSPSPSHSTPGSSSINGHHQQHQQQQYYIGHPLHQRRPSEEYMMQNQNAQNSSSNRHRRTHSYDATPQLHRGNSSNSLYSMNSQGSSTMNSEQMKLLPDPRWGGGSGGSRTRSYSGDRAGQSSQSIQIAGVQQMNNNGVGMSYSSEEYSSTRRTTSYSSDLKTTMGIAGSYSNDSQEQQQPQQVEVTSKLLYSNNNNNVGGYGSIVNNNSSGAKEVISDMMMMMNHGGEMQPLVRGNHHRRSNSEVSVSTYASGVSVDRSVEPVMTDMTKSAMFKGVTNKGVVKLQLPKDNFRLLSDRDLGEYCMFCF